MLQSVKKYKIRKEKLFYTSTPMKFPLYFLIHYITYFEMQGEVSVVFVISVSATPW